MSCAQVTVSGSDLAVAQTVSGGTVNALTTIIAAPSSIFWVSGEQFVLLNSGTGSTSSLLMLARLGTPSTPVAASSVFPNGLGAGEPIFIWAYGNAWTVTFQVRVHALCVRAEPHPPCIERLSTKPVLSNFSTCVSCPHPQCFRCPSFLQGSMHVGPQPLLVASKTSLFGSSLSLNVDRLVAGEQSLQGTFTLGYAGQLTRRLPWDASAALVTIELEALDGLGKVSVARTVNVEGFNWVVTFQSEVTPQLLVANGDGLTGAGARIAG